jgi:hypothetical protein
MRAVFIFIIVCLLSSQLSAQNKVYSNREYARSPLWIQMIQDTSANFFEVEKAYRIYFQHHENPGGEHDVIGEFTPSKKLSKRKRQKLAEENRMRMEIKKYDYWHRKMLPYVQTDGSILTPAQRLQIWESQR